MTLLAKTIFRYSHAALHVLGCQHLMNNYFYFPPKTVTSLNTKDVLYLMSCRIRYSMYQASGL
jgi:hypothetical protein